MARTSADAKRSRPASGKCRRRSYFRRSRPGQTSGRELGGGCDVPDPARQQCNGVVSFSIQETVSHYRIIRKLGAGGMGEVYLAEDTRLDRTVALKILPTDVASDKQRMQRFKQEAKLA